MRLAVLLALIMPLQGWASALSCAALDTAFTATQQHCSHDSAAMQQHHACGTCCCAAAIALMPLPWAAPRQTGPDILVNPRSAPPAVFLDRLDRPPRHV
jgi:hypothetical protein